MFMRKSRFVTAISVLLLFSAICIPFLGMSVFADEPPQNNEIPATLCSECGKVWMFFPDPNGIPRPGGHCNGEESAVCRQGSCHRTNGECCPVMAENQGGFRWCIFIATFLSVVIVIGCIAHLIAGKRKEKITNS
jgi:hypothetical protein